MALTGGNSSEGGLIDSVSWVLGLGYQPHVALDRSR